MTKACESCFYIVNLYFSFNFVNAFGLAVLSYRPSSFERLLFSAGEYTGRCVGGRTLYI